MSYSQLPETYMWLMDHFHSILPFPDISPNVSKSRLPSTIPRNLQQVLIFPLPKKKKKSSGVERHFCQGNGFLAARNGRSVLSIVRVVYSMGFEVAIFRSKSSYSTFTNPVTKRKLALSSLMYKIGRVSFHGVIVRLNYWCCSMCAEHSMHSFEGYCY